MFNSSSRKKMADSWFSYLQSQICKEFENIDGGRKNLLKEIGVKKNLKMEVEHLFFSLMERFLKKF